MPEIRANVTTELHRKLKSDAASRGVYLKELIAQVLENYIGSKKKTNAFQEIKGRKKE